jgi:hypothetical protein
LIVVIEISGAVVWVTHSAAAVALPAEETKHTSASTSNREEEERGDALEMSSAAQACNTSASVTVLPERLEATLLMAFEI